MVSEFRLLYVVYRMLERWVTFADSLFLRFHLAMDTESRVDVPAADVASVFDAWDAVVAMLCFFYSWMRITIDTRSVENLFQNLSYQTDRRQAKQQNRILLPLDRATSLLGSRDLIPSNLSSAMWDKS